MPQKYLEAANAIRSLGLCDTNAALADYWLSQWREDQPPTRSNFNPARVRKHLPGIALFEVTSAGDVFCRLTGTAIDTGLGFLLAGRNYVEFVPKTERHLRQQRLTAVVDGAVAVGRTAYRSPVGRLQMMENLHLPFSGRSETGSRQYLIHTNVRPTLEDICRRPEKWDAGFPDEFALRAFI